MAWRFANHLTVCEPCPCVWGLPIGIRGVFPPSPPLNALTLINSSSWFLISLFASSLLQFSLCRAYFLSISFPVHKTSSPNHYFLEPPISLLYSSLPFQFSFALRVLEWVILTFLILGRLWLTLEQPMAFQRTLISLTVTRVISPSKGAPVPM